jgi:hypothetical protein
MPPSSYDKDKDNTFLRNIYNHIPDNKTNKKLRWFSPQANYTGLSDRRLSAKLVPTLADRGCRVVSATNPHGR